MHVVKENSRKVEMFVARHMNGKLEEVEEGQAEFKVVYDKSNTSFLWSVEVTTDAFKGFIPMHLTILGKDESRFMKEITRMIEKREEQSQYVQIKTMRDPDGAA